MEESEVESIPCAVCGKDTPQIEHVFVKGTRLNPERQWSVIAPLYFKSAEDFTDMEEGYCSPECSTSAFQARP